MYNSIAFETVFFCIITYIVIFLNRTLSQSYFANSIKQKNIFIVW